MKEKEPEVDLSRLALITNKMDKFKFLSGSDVVITQEVVWTWDESGKKHVNQYKVIRTCGSGAYSKVKEISTENGERWAMKQFFKPSLKKTITSAYDENNHIRMSNSLATVYDEIDNWSWINNTNIVKLKEFLDDPHCDYMYLIMDLCDLGQICNWDNALKKYLRNEEVVKNLNEGTSELKEVSKQE